MIHNTQEPPEDKYTYTLNSSSNWLENWNIVDTHLDISDYKGNPFKKMRQRILNDENNNDNDTPEMPNRIQQHFHCRNASGKFKDSREAV